MSYSEICVRVDNLSGVDELSLIGLNKEMKSVARTEETRLFQLSLRAMESNNTTQRYKVQQTVHAGHSTEIYLLI